MGGKQMVCFSLRACASIRAPWGAMRGLPWSTQRAVPAALEPSWVATNMLHQLSTSMSTSDAGSSRVVCKACLHKRARAIGL